jgi:hypothetical protein
MGSGMSRDGLHDVRRLLQETTRAPCGRRGVRHPGRVDGRHSRLLADRMPAAGHVVTMNRSSSVIARLWRAHSSGLTTAAALAAVCNVREVLSLIEISAESETAG